MTRDLFWFAGVFVRLRAGEIVWEGVQRAFSGIIEIFLDQTQFAGLVQGLGEKMGRAGGSINVRGRYLITERSERFVCLVTKHTQSSDSVLLEICFRDNCPVMWYELNMSVAAYRTSTPLLSSGNRFLTQRTTAKINRLQLRANLQPERPPI